MLKNKSKIAVFFVAILLVCSTLSFATNPENANPEDLLRTSDITTTSADNVDTTSLTDDAALAAQQEIHNGDLYVFDNNIVMDKLVDGNVFLFGSSIEVNGKVNGSLYAFGNDIKFGSDSYIVQSIYAFGNSIELNGSATDLYAFASQVNMSYDSFMVRDLRVFASTFNFSGGVGRNAFVEATNFNFVTTDQSSAIVYGNLEYTSSKELSLSKDFVQGDISFKQKVYTSEQTTSEMILDKVVSFCNTLVYNFIVFLLCIWLAPKFLQKAASYVSVKRGFSCIGIGLLFVIASVIIGFVLLFWIVGYSLGLMLLAITALLSSIAMAITCICIAYKLKEKFNYSKDYMTYLTVAGVILAIWALKMLPYVGWIVSLLVSLFGLGVIIHYLFTKEKNNNEDDKKVEKTVKVEKIEKTEKKEIPAKKDKPVKEEKKTTTKETAKKEIAKKETQKKPEKETAKKETQKKPKKEDK